MNTTLRTAVGVAALAMATQAAAQVTFYEAEDFRGRSFTTERQIGNLERFGFNDRASSAIVRGGRWEVCEDARFSGQCVVLRPGRYESLREMGLNNQVSSVRAVNRNAANRGSGPAYIADNGYRTRDDEQVYQADVTSVRAVVGPPEQRCWIEREQVQGGGDVNVPGAVVGAIIGGVLGHQVGGGRGRDVATGVGAVGGAAVGANVGRGGGQVYSQDVQRCTNVASTRPDYWDVTYNFRGMEHRVQMTAPPGPSILVNGNGEPRT
jgi:uncharacterized protein YcfJ